MNNKAATLWWINIMMALLVFILAVTGLLNWWVIPKGYAIRGSFLISVRHIFLQVHQWAALLFIFILALHLYLHWSYVITNLKKYGFLKK